MNKNTRTALIDFLESLKGNCSCSPKDRDRWHLIDCNQPHIDEKIDELIDLLLADETIL